MLDANNERLNAVLNKLVKLTGEKLAPFHLPQEEIEQHCLWQLERWIGDEIDRFQEETSILIKYRK